MDIKFYDLDPRIATDSLKLVDGTFIAECHMKKERAACPCCGKKTSSIHSKYVRDIRDLPVSGKPVIIRLQCNKYICRNPKCKSHGKTFTAGMGFVSRRGRMTKRLEDRISQTAASVSSVSAQNLLRKSGIQVSKSTICSMLKKKH